MMFLKNLKKIAFLALTSFAVIPASAQDLLASQAPIDRTMKSIDSIALKSIIQKENSEVVLGANLYNEWSNQYTHKETVLPDSFLIDLRGFHMPTDRTNVTSNFGYRWRRQHKGIDVKVYIGDTIRSAFNGKVRIVKYDRRGYGKYVVIRHYNGLETIYGHMSKWLVAENQEVKAGDPIGLGGNTGRSTGSHLHFETRLCGVALNPALMFDFHNQDVIGDYYMFQRSTYQRESAVANRLRGAGAKGGKNNAEMELARQKPAKSAVAANVRYHKVKKGESLSTIARKHGTTIKALCNLNHISTRTRLMPGQILKYN
ncbi:MAG: peptidoglycan DD-metalloendopeptidase family protein [Prevotella sp.]|nr:peptidoglycan DD-metalloendopeptidase family protein [Prevotella sp.]MBR2015852.1 peptidoglycan DD-metalloendopeptidase family protein [Prevotella sp.]